ncbi:MAG: hypothetical protein NVV74_02620 [Magnetospirillum sp.]|nr:hypothetical protein [Magnetospirillum sp.]
MGEAIIVALATGYLYAFAVASRAGEFALFGKVDVPPDMEDLIMSGLKLGLIFAIVSMSAVGVYFASNLIKRLRDYRVAITLCAIYASVWLLSYKFLHAPQFHDDWSAIATFFAIYIGMNLCGEKNPELALATRTISAIVVCIMVLFAAFLVVSGRQKLHQRTICVTKIMSLLVDLVTLPYATRSTGPRKWS